MPKLNRRAILLFLVAASLCIVSAPLTLVSAQSGALLDSYNAAGDRQDDFLVGDDVYAQGSGFASSTGFTILVYDDGVCPPPPAVPDHEDDIVWSNGRNIPVGPLVASVEVTSDASGNIPLTLVVEDVGGVWQCFDMVIDVNSNGIYDQSVDALDDNDTCNHDNSGFFVVPEYTVGAAMALSASLAAFLFFKGIKRQALKPQQTI